MARIMLFVDRWLGRLSGAYSFWPLVPAGAFAVLVGYLSSTVAWINQYGAFGWVVSGVLAFLAGSVALLCLATAWGGFERSRATRKWMGDVSQVNPMRPSFQSERISISDLAHPIDNTIKGKVFNQCELIGPSNVFFLTGNSVNNPLFMNCDTVIIKDDCFLNNVVKIVNCSFIGGEIWNCTFFMPQSMYDQVLAAIPGFPAITYQRDAP